MTFKAGHLNPLRLRQKTYELTVMSYVYEKEKERDRDKERDRGREREGENERDRQTERERGDLRRDKIIIKNCTFIFFCDIFCTRA